MKEDCQKQFTTAQKKIDASISNPTTTVERAKALKKSLELAIQAVMEAELQILKRGKSFFGFYKTMLGENAQVKWARIVEAQVGVKPWMDLQGEVHQAICNYSADSFRDCVKFHLLLVFTYDTAEHQSTILVTD